MGTYYDALKSLLDKMATSATDQESNLAIYLQRHLKDLEKFLERREKITE